MYSCCATSSKLIPSERQMHKFFSSGLFPFTHLSLLNWTESVISSFAIFLPYITVLGVSCLLLKLWQVALFAGCVSLFRSHWHLHSSLFWFVQIVIICWNQNVGIRCLENARHESQVPASSLGMKIAPWLEITELPKFQYCDLTSSGTCKEGKTC